MQTPSLLSIQVGFPQWLGVPGAPAPADRPWRTAFVKRSVEGPVRLARSGLDGDGQADTRHHGGPEMAVLAYASAHYPRWRAEMGLAELSAGGFGENFTIAGLSEETVCIGDAYALGLARVQVSMPRIPCGNISRRWRLPELTGRVRQTGRTGWYLRVLEEAEVKAGLLLTLLDRPHEAWSVARANRVLHAREGGEDATRELVACAFLSPVLRERLARRAPARSGRT